MKSKEKLNNIKLEMQTSKRPNSLSPRGKQNKKIPAERQVIA